jgi:hypothetical protein
MKLWNRSDTPSPEPEEEESRLNITLCDYCDAEFYSDAFYEAHEKICGLESALPNEEATVDLEIVISDDEEYETHDVIDGQKDFMAYFTLVTTGSKEPPRRNNSMCEKSLSPKKKRPNQRTRKVVDKKEKDREKTIPFSSPAGNVLTKKAVVNENYIEESIKDYEHFCTARPNTKIPNRPRLTGKLTGPENAVVRDMRKQRIFYWPRKTHHSLSHGANFEFLNRSLIRKMKPCMVILEKLTSDNVQGIQSYMQKKREEKLKIKEAQAIDLCSDSDSDSIAMDDGSKVPNLEKMNFQGEFVTMSYQTSTYQMNEAAQPAFFGNRNDIFFSQGPTNSSSSTSRVFHQQIIINSTATRSQRSRENVEIRHNQQSIQNWIQTVNGENSFCGITN